MSVAEIAEMIKGLSAEDRQQLAQACGTPEVKREPTAAERAGPSGSSSMGTQARISQFSGEGAKGDVSFEQWRFEVRSMVKDGIFAEPIILQTLRRSLRGTAADVLLHMGAEVSVEDVLTKMERIFGNILPPEAILEQFYSAKQMEREKVATWACRLEDVLSKLQDCQDKEVPLVSGAVAKTMLRTKFYSGLRTGPLRNAIRHNFDSGATYEDLLVAARVAELEEEQDRKTAKVQQVSANDGATDQVLAGLEAMNKRLKQVEETQNKMADTQGRKDSSQTTKRPFTGKCFGCGEEGHPRYRCPLNLKQPASGARQQAEETQQAPTPK